MAVTPTYAIGSAVPPRVWAPGEVQLFLFSAATWNSHRIHYDAVYARHEGYEGVLVQSHLHACFIATTVRAYCGSGARLTAIGWQNRAPAIAGDRLTVTGTVAAVEPSDGGRVVTFDLEEHNQRGELCVRATAKAWVA
jgi:hydroxyacyl-ACP dehydratase HTD2-like protein with hotdog domain